MASSFDFITPETGDGWITHLNESANGQLSVELSFPLSDAFRGMAQGREKEVIFSARSRLARLGVDIVPTGPVRFDSDFAKLSAGLHFNVSSYGVEPLVRQLPLVGLAVGRLVFCPDEQRLTSQEVFEQFEQRKIQLPEDFSISQSGDVTIRPHRRVYNLARPLTVSDMLTLIARPDGRAILNRLQVPTEVNHIVVPPKEGVITSCSMFLHQHYVVLESEDSELARHLRAVVLDPVTTRGTSIFLEFFNPTDRPVINPYATARVFRAQPATPKARVFLSGTLPEPVAADAGDPEYVELSNLFDELESTRPGRSYLHRLVGISPGDTGMPKLSDVQLAWSGPDEGKTDSIWSHTARGQESVLAKAPGRFGTSQLGDLPDGGKATLLLGYFPNFVEHLQICQAALRKAVGRILFRRASFEHGCFFSARDHGRLADYESLGVQVLWANEIREHVARHVFRGQRGYFVKPEDINRLQSALVFAFYGSARALSKRQGDNMRALVEGLRNVFGDNMAILTGGGPGAMQQAADIAQSMDLLTGANFIETADQGTNQTVDFYQTFQDRSRHYRQRWFDISSFQLFCVGGVGTLEEVGLTLTDMKLGVIELGPVVFFGTHDVEPYWNHQVEQLHRIADRKRGPQWLRSHVLLTADAEEVPRFYRKALSLG